MKEIDVGQLDSEFKSQIANFPGGENLMACFACGTCTAGCPVGAVEDRYNPRRIIHMALLGMKKEVLSSNLIWLCSTCYTCDERCPQDVRIAEVMNILKNIATREGYAHPSYIEQARLIQEYGRLYEIDEFDNKKRDRLSLPTISSESDEIRQIFRITGLDEVVSRSEEEKKR